MRDLVIVGLVAVLCLVALRRPWIGALAWAWLSLMNPHKYAWGFAVNAPLAQSVALCTLAGLLFTRNRWTPIPASPMVWFAVFTVWITVSWLMGYHVEANFDQWLRVMKINFMIFITAMLIRTQFQINVFIVVAVFSLALLGAKGGLFVFSTGGAYRVWGPPTSYINGNNEFAVALVAIIPLLRYVQLQMERGLLRHGMTGIMVLCGAASLGSQSRGALLAAGAMVFMLWWRGTRNRLSGAIVVAILAVPLVIFMPDSWTARMNTISNYEEDASAMGRIAAWTMAFHAANAHFFGLGMDATKEAWFLAYSPYGLTYGTPVAHSIYFQVLGHHGWVGLFIYMAMWASTWRACAGLRRDARSDDRLRWVGDLGGMVQVSLIGFLAGGAFLNLAYYDMSFYTLLVACLAVNWVRRRAWEEEPEPPPIGWGMWRWRPAEPGLPHRRIAEGRSA